MKNQNRISSAVQPVEQFRPTTTVVATEQADTTVLLDLRNGRYYTLNPVSGLIWSVLTPGASIAHMVSRVQEEFEAPQEEVLTDVEDFVGSLLSAKLIRRCG